MNIFTHKYRVDGCSWYRIKQPLSVLGPEFKVDEIDSAALTENEIVTAVKWADIFYLRPGCPHPSLFIKDIKQYYPNKKIVFDTDDDLFNISPLSDAYSAGGTKEVFADGKPLWVEDKRFDTYKNRKGLIDYEYCLVKSDVVLTTTDRLASTIKPFNRNVQVVPNAINFNIFPRLDIKKDDKIRILWSGGSSHYEDMYSVKSTLETLMKEYKNLHLYILGNPFEGITKDMDQTRVHKDGWIDASGHGYRLASLNADIAICPLVDNEFNQNKSSIKYYEVSALGLPCVCKDMLPYSSDITHNVNGLLYKDDFYKQVKFLIDNEADRKRLGEAAYQWVKENRNLDDVGKTLVTIFNSL